MSGENRDRQLWDNSPVRFSSSDGVARSCTTMKLLEKNSDRKALKKRTMKKLMSAFLTVSGVLSAQHVQIQDENSARMATGAAPIYHINVTERTAKAISYQHRSGATKIDFGGTSAMPDAHGEAKVESKQGYVEIEVEFRNLPEATKFGAEYLTYVLWAVTPEGRTSNLGEILRNGTSSKLDVTTELQAFALIVTAEPYFAVSRPSDIVVMENVVRPDTAGKVELIDAKYELLQRGQYQHLANVLELHLDRKMPLELYEARNAIQIARSSGADRYATETFQKAESNLKQAETYWVDKAGSKPVTMSARQAVQIAEDARTIAVKRQDDEQSAGQHQADADRASNAENARATAQSETDRVTREAADARSKAEAEAERLRRANDVQSAAADRLKQENEAKLIAARADLERAAREKAQAEAEKMELRAKLLQQFNSILQTRDTARGLIVNMSDVLFDTGKYSLRAPAREKLAKVAGIVSGHPGLRLDVEGYTDSVGSDDSNQRLSEQRGSAVRDYLTQQGMPSSSVTSKGLGKSQPVASNDTAEGRQQNRRVELVISGEVIGMQIGTPVGTPIADR
jgi:outer membrane protein OmpA-like peptidoglycan-associated protein